MDQIYKKTCIPHHFLYSIFDKYCTNFKPLILAESTYSQHFPLFYLIDLFVNLSHILTHTLTA